MPGSDRYDDRRPIILFTGPPGSGKTWSVLKALDEAGLRIFYAAPRHDLWETIQVMAAQASHRREWHKIWGRIGPQERDGELVYPGNCVEHELVDVLQRKRYDIRTNACKKVCGGTYMSQVCPYYKQFKERRRHWFAVHGHVTHTELYDDFDVIVIDEDVYSAFTETVEIEHRDMALDTTPEIRRLLNLFQSAMVSSGDETETLFGRRLFEELDAISQALYEKPLAEIADAITFDAVYGTAYPEFTKETAAQLPMNFFGDLWDVFSHELQFYRQNLENWCYRLVLERGPDRAGQIRLNLIVGAPKTDKPIVCLNAGGEPTLYERLFQRPVEVEEAQMPLKGKVFQVTTRQNNITALRSKTNDQPWRELLAMLHKLVEEEPRSFIVTYKALAAQVRKEFPGVGVGWFGALSGSNELDREHRRMRGLPPLKRIIVAGTPMPPLDKLLEEANRLFWQDGGRFISEEWVEVDRAYPGVSVWTCSNCEAWFWEQAEAEEHVAAQCPGVEIQRKAAALPVSEFADPRANMLLRARREVELLQVAHRIRAVRYDDVDIWLLTNIPVPGLPPDKLMTVKELLGYTLNWRLDAVESFVQTVLDAEGQVCQADVLNHLQLLNGNGKEGRNFSYMTARKYFQMAVKKMNLVKIGEQSTGRGSPSPVYGLRKVEQG